MKKHTRLKAVFGPDFKYSPKADYIDNYTINHS